MGVEGDNEYKYVEPTEIPPVGTLVHRKPANVLGRHLYGCVVAHPIGLNDAVLVVWLQGSTGNTIERWASLGVRVLIGSIGEDDV